MTALVMPYALPVLAGAAVVVALIAYRTERRPLYVLSKAVGSLAFVGLGIAEGAARGGWPQVALMALAVSAVGDVALGFRGRSAFIAGLASFAIAHAVFVAAFLLHGVAVLPFALFAAAFAAAGVLLWRAFRTGIPRALRIPVALYLVIVSLMAAAGAASGLAHRALPLGLGAVLVAASDVAVARERFGTPGFGNKLFGLPAYYLGQVLIALSLRA